MKPVARPDVSAETVRELACAGRRRADEAAAWVPCPDRPSAEVLRSCHGEVKHSDLCPDHLSHALTGGSSKCGTCLTRTVVLVAVLPIGGAA